MASGRDREPKGGAPGSAIDDGGGGSGGGAGEQGAPGGGGGGGGGARGSGIIGEVVGGRVEQGGPGGERRGGARGSGIIGEVVGGKVEKGAPKGRVPGDWIYDEVGGARREVWLFGYGSLIWRPDVAFSARTPAVLRGYQRRFWQRSTDHRGTATQPGRVVTLVPCPEGRVVGVAYRLVDPVATLARVDVREQQGYTRTALPIELVGEGGRPRTAVVYVADPANPYFAGDEELEVTAAVVAGAHGPSGKNLEYARALAAALAELVAAHGEELALSAADLAYEQALLAHAERHRASVDPARLSPVEPAGAQ